MFPVPNTRALPSIKHIGTSEYTEFVEVYQNVQSELPLRCSCADDKTVQQLWLKRNPLHKEGAGARADPGRKRVH